jgi:hypothetical protein
MSKDKESVAKNRQDVLRQLLEKKTKDMSDSHPLKIKFLQALSDNSSLKKIFNYPYNPFKRDYITSKQYQTDYMDYIKASREELSKTTSIKEYKKIYSNLEKDILQPPKKLSKELKLEISDTKDFLQNNHPSVTLQTEEEQPNIKKPSLFNRFVKTLAHAFKTQKMPYKLDLSDSENDSLEEKKNQKQPYNILKIVSAILVGVILTCAFILVFSVPLLAVAAIATAVTLSVVIYNKFKEIVKNAKESDLLSKSNNIDKQKNKEPAKEQAKQQENTPDEKKDATKSSLTKGHTLSSEQASAAKPTPARKSVEAMALDMLKEKAARAFFDYDRYDRAAKEIDDEDLVRRTFLSHKAKTSKEVATRVKDGAIISKDDKLNRAAKAAAINTNTSGVSDAKKAGSPNTASSKKSSVASSDRRKS